MRNYSIAFAALIVAATAFTACHSIDGSAQRLSNGNANFSTPVPADGIRRITVDELKAAVDKGEVLIVDTRGDEPYKTEHIMGAISIPSGNVAARSNELPKDKLIVFYCS